MPLFRWTMALVATSLLAACSSFPLPADVDLKARLGDDATGRVETPVAASPAQDLETAFPDGGECVDFADEAIPVTVERAKLHWNVDVDYEGPDLTGRVQGRLYVAGAGEELFHPSNALGPAVTVKLDRTTTRFAGSAVLNPDQLRAVNDRVVCVGVRIRGDDVAAAASGDAVIRYDVRDLWMRIGFSVL